MVLALVGVRRYIARPSPAATPSNCPSGDTAGVDRRGACQGGGARAGAQVPERQLLGLVAAVHQRLRVRSEVQAAADPHPGGGLAQGAVGGRGGGSRHGCGLRRLIIGVIDGGQHAQPLFVIGHRLGRAHGLAQLDYLF